MEKYINADKLIAYLTSGLIEFYNCDGYRMIPEEVKEIMERALEHMEIADVREVIEADGYKHLICPHCLSEFFAKTKAEMFCPDCGKKFFFSEKCFDFPYVGENIERGNGLP